MRKIAIALFIVSSVVIFSSCITVPSNITPGVYDNFDNQKYDGKFDKGKWIADREGSVRYIQFNGKLTFYTNDAVTTEIEKRLYSRAIKLNLRDVKSISAKLSLNSINNKSFSHVAVNLQTITSEGNEFWIEADLMNNNTHPVLFCKIGYFGTNNFEEHSFVYDKDLSYDEEYDVRIDFDQSIGLVKWSIDDMNIHETVSKEYLVNKELPCILVINSYRAEGSNAKSTVDDASIYW